MISSNPVKKNIFCALWRHSFWKDSSNFNSFHRFQLFPYFYESKSNLRVANFPDSRQCRPDRLSAIISRVAFYVYLLRRRFSVVVVVVEIVVVVVVHKDVKKRHLVQSHFVPTCRFETRHRDRATANQCDQIGRFVAIWATFLKSLATLCWSKLLGIIWKRGENL